MRERVRERVCEREREIRSQHLLRARVSYHAKKKERKKKIMATVTIDYSY